MSEATQNRSEEAGKDSKKNVYLVCNAKYHDTNFARLELLKLLGEQEDIWTHVASDFSDLDTIASCELLITYTCDLCPTPEQQTSYAMADVGWRYMAHRH